MIARPTGTTIGSAMITLLAALAYPGTSLGATLEAWVTSNDDQPMKDAVVYARPGSSNSEVLATGVIDQIDKEYAPHVTAVFAGTAINFPNSDRVRHHVYSFSPAKSFEIPLYKGMPPSPIVFEQSGVVTLGCNIHDWMKAYVLVLDTPHFAVTGADGRAILTGLPAGDYSFEVWHPKLSGEPASTREQLSLGADTSASLRFGIQQKRVWRPRRSPSAAGGAGYR